MSRARLTIPKAGTVTLEVGGREVRLTNLDKPFWPEDGITKGDLIQYYADVSEVILPHLEGRPVSMERFPDGIEGERFFQKDIAAYYPSWVSSATRLMPRRCASRAHSSPSASGDGMFVKL